MTTATDDSRPLLTVAEVRDLLGVTDRTLYSWRKSGVLPASKLGGVIRYRRSRIDDLLERMEAAS